MGKRFLYALSKHRTNSVYPVCGFRMKRFRLDTLSVASLSKGVARCRVRVATNLTIKQTNGSARA